MYRRMLIGAAALVTIAGPAQAAPGDLDRSFANNGRAAFSVFGGGGGVAGLALVDGTRPLLSVGAYRNGQLSRVSLQLTSRGRLARQTALPDPSTARFANGYAVAAAPGAAGAFTLRRIGSAQRVTLTVPQKDFVLSSFGVDRAGRAILVGYTYANDAGVNGLALRFQRSGSLDTTWATRGVFSLGRGSSSAVLVKRDGRAYIASGDKIAGLDATGRPLRGFVNDALSRGGRYILIRLLVPGPGETLLVGGYLGGGFVGRLRADGRLDSRFGDRGLLYGSPLRGADVSALTRDRRGRLLVAGYSTDSHVQRLSARGRIDRSFGDRGIKRFRLGFIRGVRIVNSSAEFVAVDDRDRIVVAGQVYDDDYDIRDDHGNPYPAIARLMG